MKDNTKSKKRKYSYAAMTSVVLAVAVIIILNVTLNVLSDKINLTFDVTSDGILEFSESTNDVIDGLETEIDIISLVPENDSSTEMKQVDEVLRKYANMSGKINYMRQDAQKNPGLFQKYLVDGSVMDNVYHVIFINKSNPDVYTVVDIDDLLIYEESRLKSLAAEQFFTAALLKVASGSNVPVYILQGHGEVRNAEVFAKGVLPGSVYEFKDLNLMTEDIPADADLLVLASPGTDYTNDEIAKIDKFVRDGGGLQVFVDPDTPDMTNLFGYLEEWGINVGEGVACEGDSSHYTANSPYVLVPEIPSNAVNDKIYSGNAALIFKNARPVSAENKYDITAFTLASTTDEGYVKTNAAYGAIFAPGDSRMSADVAVMAERGNSKVFVSGTGLFLQEESNHSYYSNLISYMADENQLVYIEPKDVSQSKVVITQDRIYIYAVVICVLVPVIIIVLGFIIWARRRHL